jgi:hypothetical protein
LHRSHHYRWFARTLYIARKPSASAIHSAAIKDQINPRKKADHPQPEAPRLAASRSSVAVAPRPIGAAQSGAARSLFVLAANGASSRSFFI